jgi:hypothetical protein
MGLAFNSLVILRARAAEPPFPKYSSAQLNDWLTSKSSTRLQEENKK